MESFPVRTSGGPTFRSTHKLGRSQRALRSSHHGRSPRSRRNAEQACRHVVDGDKPDRFDIIGASICLVGVAVTMYAPSTTV